MDSKRNGAKSTHSQQDLIRKTQKKFGYNFFSVSNEKNTFGALPLGSVETPPRLKIRNPFESLIVEKLHDHVMSPSIFNQYQTPENQQKFKWNIDDMSYMKPTVIDHKSLIHQESNHVSVNDHNEDAMMESYVQEKIDKYFSMTEIVPSPLTQTVEQITKPSDANSKKDSQTQTMLSFPSELPEHIINLLKPYFCNDGRENASEEKEDNVYAQLFPTEHDHGILTSPQDSSPARSLHFSPVNCTPLISRSTINKLNAYIESPGSALDFSPICYKSPQMLCNNSQKLVKKLDFTNVDISVLHESNSKVPDILNDSGANNEEYATKRCADTSSCDTESVDWDIEHEEICDKQKEAMCLNEMDVSISNTPKSKIISSQRKNLSSSCLMEYDEHVTDCHMYEKKENIENTVFDHRGDRDVDSDYYSNAATFSEDSNFSMAHMTAISTPTKQRSVQMH